MNAVDFSALPCDTTLLDMINAGILKLAEIDAFKTGRRNKRLHFRLERLDQLSLPIAVEFR
ncbi:hypothetical protein D3C84_1218850 [compost metagenome]